jgi:hypothetical protein
MLFDDAALLMVQMTVVEIVDVVAMLDGHVAAAGAVLVRMISVDMLRHGPVLYVFPDEAAGLLAGVLDRVVDQVQHMGVRDRIRSSAPSAAASRGRPSASPSGAPRPS